MTDGLENTILKFIKDNERKPRDTSRKEAIKQRGFAKATVSKYFLVLEREGKITRTRNVGNSEFHITTGKK